MQMMSRSAPGRLRAVLPALWLALLPGAAAAYVGPGAGLSAIGTLVALVGAVFLAIVGFIWYPIKRLLRGRRPAPGAEREAGPGSED
jgi:hypothetical protein